MSTIDAVREERSLPRRNGELVFEAPWESRAFSVAVALADAGQFEWEDFRSRLIATIGGGDRGAVPAEWNYYERWMEALTDLLLDRGLLSAVEIEQRMVHTAHAQAHEHDHPR
jgi:nitrile hydratase accessory protein